MWKREARDQIAGGDGPLGIATMAAPHYRLLIPDIIPIERDLSAFESNRDLTLSFPHVRIGFRFRPIVRRLSEGFESRKQHTIRP